VSPTTADHVRAAFTEEQVYVLDGGPCRAGIESTVLWLGGAPPRILRPGVISAAEISRVLGEEVAAPTAEPTRPGTPLASPGQLPSHYAPLSRAALTDAAQLPSLLSAARGPVVVLSHSGLHAEPPHTVIAMPADAAAYAARLYAALREADALRPYLIAVERPPSEGPIWDAIADRLRRATA
jgi:L-threonylcarbamoyladenylate synthase